MTAGRKLFRFARGDLLQYFAYESDVVRTEASR